MSRKKPLDYKTIKVVSRVLEDHSYKEINATDKVTCYQSVDEDIFYIMNEQIRPSNYILVAHPKNDKGKLQFLNGSPDIGEEPLRNSNLTKFPKAPNEQGALCHHGWRIRFTNTDSLQCFLTAYDRTK